MFIAVLCRYGIELAGKSTDGDPRCLSAMVYEASLPKEIRIKTTQDPTHIGTKTRNRLLKNDINLPMGIYKVSIDHLKTLINNTQKSVHGLTFSDVFPVDRMNYHSFDKIIQERVLNALEQRVPNSNATIQYLKTFRDIIDSYLKFDLTPLERVLSIWRGAYFLRIWRAFIDKSSHYTTTENFVTYNVFTSVQMNAMTLNELIKMFRDSNTPDQFLPTLFDSQTCERIFRTFRSMGTSNYTKINFSLLELIHMIGRVEVESDIKYCKLNFNGIELPHKRSVKSKVYQLPTDVEIHNTMEKAKEEAFEIAKSFGMTTFLANACQIDDYQFKSRLSFDDDNDNELYEDEYEDETDDDHVLMPNDENFGEYHEEYYQNSNKNIDIDVDIDIETNQQDVLDPMSPLVYVIDENGDRRLISKSSYLWMVTEPGVKLSNDRTRRFMSNVAKKRRTE